MDSATDDTVEQLTAAMVAERDCGEVTLRVSDRPALGSGETTIGLDALIERWGFQGIGDAWREIDRAVAEALVDRLLRHGLAYDIELMPASHALPLRQRFFALFSAGARYFTNTCDSGWTPVSTATFDALLICLDQHLIGMLCVQEED